jgi:hypothetical protein
MGILSSVMWMGVCGILVVSIYKLSGMGEIVDNIDKQKDVWDVLRESGLNPLQAFPSAVIDRLKDIGKAESRLERILDDDMLNTTSKHNPYWDHPDEAVSDKLEDIRISLRCLSDNLWDVMQILLNGE